jgi:hypothetical protein
MLTNVFRIASVSALIALGGAAQAATITWATPQNATGNASDVITSGSLFAAATTGPTTTLNGVTFANAFSSSIVLSGVDTITGIYSNPNFADSNYNQSLSVGAYSNSGNPFSITISGLTIGNTYALQIFEPFWNNNWATAFTAGNTSGLVNLTGPDQGVGASEVPQFVTGTFTALTGTQTITLSSPTSYVLVAAMQVRDVTTDVPEPASWAMLIAGFGLTGAAMRRRRQVAA